MLLAIILGFLGGLMGVNSLPHFVKGVSHESFPMAFGSSPVRNAVAGWVGLVVSGLLLYFADIPAHPEAVLGPTAVGALPAALYHSSGRAARSLEKGKAAKADNAG
ncbi:hypothetical protein ABWJ92_28290 [Streptomyces sp. NPDC000609]|uniref:hypothetical protein n=1 Tax=Streptomyces sp. NPDC000609 TaxID=3160957 RepID=UPI003398E020